MHKVSILALEGVVPFDLGIACEVFGRSQIVSGELAYEVRVCGQAQRVTAQAFAIGVPCGLDAIAAADTVVIPGVDDPASDVSGPVLSALHSAWTNGARLVSICTGAFALAATGLLDGRRATTHWMAAQAFTRRFPKVLLDPHVLFVDEGRLVTSAGALAGMDMCLHLVRRDHGQAAAAHAARLAVAPLHRDGGQSQFIRHELPTSNESLAPLLDWMLANLDQPLCVDTLATHAVTSPRTFARRFRDQTGTTPLQWLLTARIRRAQELLETTLRSIEDIATMTGFEATVTFRARFSRSSGSTQALTAAASTPLRTNRPRPASQPRPERRRCLLSRRCAATPSITAASVLHGS